MDQIVRAVEPDYETVRAMLDALKRRFPHARLGVCGRSLGGRSIYTLSIGPQENPVLYTGGFHGQEWLTPLLLLRFFERTATAVWEGDDFSAIPIQDALHVAAMPPYRIMDACGRALALLEDMADKGSRQLLSDVACGAVFCRAAMQGASLTLFANTTSMKDRVRAEELETACDELLDTWLPRADALARRASGESALPYART